ncbi:MAG: drug/metabolite exporter YedA [Chloroflexi bacterium]|nr:drug/metabolite exporter YedA [Chloroflexota bacterium]MDA8186747.1 drug/metabolite exporter YedA [Dehalococcoidales bacterium]
MRKMRLPGRTLRLRVVVAFAAIYLIWGSTYLAIRFAIETLPPFLMAGTRFLVAGAMLYGFARLRGAPRPAWFHWRAATVVGGLLLLGGNGGIVWAEQRVPSGMAALLVATVPLWMVLLDWVGRQGTRPSAGLVARIVLGFAGVALLLEPADLPGSSFAVDQVGAAVIMLASASWATGSLYARRARLPAAPLLTTAMEMLAGGSLLLVAGSVMGEWATLHSVHVSLRSILSVGYLIVFGSLVGFTAYIWLLRVATPARVSTYAYVNPVVAVILGWALAGEPLTPRTLMAAAVIVAAVVMITVSRTHEDARESQAQLASAGKGWEAAACAGAPSAQEG